MTQQLHLLEQPFGKPGVNSGVPTVAVHNIGNEARAAIITGQWTRHTSHMHISAQTGKIDVMVPPGWDGSMSEVVLWIYVEFDSDDIREAAHQLAYDQYADAEGHAQVTVGPRPESVVKRRGTGVQADPSNQKESVMDHLETEANVTVFSPDSKMGGQVYPFLQQFDDWRIASSKPKDHVAERLGLTPTLRWVKDNRVIDLFIDGMDHTEFLSRVGLQLNLHKGTFVMSKRLSRVMRPHFYYATFNTGVLNICEDPALDPDVWDGAALINRRVLDGVRNCGSDGVHELTELEQEPFWHELDTCLRWEFTVMTDAGQYKGHALVIDDPEGPDLIVPVGSAKREVQMTGGVFVGLHPVHGRDDLRLDIQSVINLHPFIEEGHLIEWLREDATEFLTRIEDGTIDKSLSKLWNIRSAHQLRQYQSWHVTNLLASGGSAMWFPGTVKSIYSQYRRRYYRWDEGTNTQQMKFRFPAPGGRYYIWPDTVGNLEVPRGMCKVDPETSTCWVNAQEYVDTIVPVLGGCDGDDALWIFPFVDRDNDDHVQYLIWRSPNQLGEYMLMTPMEHHFSTLPHMDSDLLPSRIDTMETEYGELEAFPPEQHDSYSIEAMDGAISNATANASVLGAYCNALMVIKALYGKMPKGLPARLEDVIDGSVKAPVDLQPVRDWIEHAMRSIVGSNKPVPAYLAPRIMPALYVKGQPKPRVRYSEEHWIDVLVRVVAGTMDQLDKQVEQICNRTQPPAAIIEIGSKFPNAGNQLRRRWQEATQNASLSLKEVARHCTDGFVSDGFFYQALMDVAAQVYIKRQNDAILWQMDVDGRPGTATIFLDALRRYGIIGEAIWTDHGAVRYWSIEDEPAATAVIKLNGVWFNYLRAIDSTTPERMGDVHPERRNDTKLYLPRLVKFQDMVLRFEQHDGRTVAMSSKTGRLVGFLDPKYHVDFAAGRIVWHKADDGNIHAIVEAC